MHTPPPASPRLPAPGDLCVDGAASSTPKRRASASPLTSSSLEDGEDVKPVIVKQERMDTSSSPEESGQSKKSRTEVADAESNTTNSGRWILPRSLQKQKFNKALVFRNFDVMKLLTKKSMVIVKII